MNQGVNEVTVLQFYYQMNFSLLECNMILECKGITFESPVYKVDTVAAPHFEGKCL